MNRFKQDIWSLHRVIFVFCAVFFSWFCTMEWDHSQEFYSNKQSEGVKAISSSVSSILSSQESSMRLLIHRLESTTFQKSETSSFLEGVFNEYRYLTSVSIMDKNQNIIASTSVSKNIPEAQSISLTDYPALLSGLGQMTKPLIAIPSADSKSVSLVMPFYFNQEVAPSFLLFTGDSFPYSEFLNSSKRASDTITAIFNSSGNQIASFNSDDKNKPLQSVMHDFNHLRLLAQMSTIDASKDNNHYEFFKGESRYNEEDFFYSIAYNRDFQTWVISASDYDLVYSDFLSHIGPSFLGFAIIQLFFFSLVWRMSKKDQDSMRKLTHQANHDYLTNLPNRYFIREKFENWSKENPLGSTIFIIGLDRFKNINDIHGQMFADRLLVEMSERLQGMNLDRSIVARENGDEFIILTSIINEDAVNQLAKDILKEIAKPYHFSIESSIATSCSIGVATYPENGGTLEQIIRSANIAMDEAKKEKGTYILFNDEMIHSHMFKATIENRLRMALKTKAISVHYQPQVNENGSLYGVEALVRWTDDMLGVVRPDIFIPVAEKCGLIDELGETIKLIAMTEMKQIQDKFNISFQTSINISVKQINGADFINSILNASKNTDYPLDRLTLEITESVFSDNLEMINMKFEALRESGVKVSLDDFGTGYSSLSMLNNISIDELKIDKSFIDHIANDERASRMVQSIITLGKNFDTVVIAEGIESKQDHLSLIDMGCDLFQGYFFSKPLSFNAFDFYLEEYLGKNMKLVSM